MATDPLSLFHPAVAEWFRRRFPAGPTPAQAGGWKAIAEGSDTLVSAPTGSGKTLAAFLVAIDRCVRVAESRPGRRTSVVYVSPLKALTVDVRENLERPLAEIDAIAAELGLRTSPVRVAVRNGDTAPAARAAMLRDPPDVLVTTPESLYLLVTSRRGRELLGDVGTVIVDEIHAVARDKRGSHLALTLERLDRCVTSGRPDHPRPIRIGLSATQRPIETVARLLVGACDERGAPGGSRPCAVVDVGHRRALDLSVALTGDELGAVTTTGHLDSVVRDLAEAVGAHRTTLVFVNTRRMAERIAHLLAEQLGPDSVRAHHGSLSTERRAQVETGLRSGELRCVVATASLELGIDVGPVELVCQIGSPRSIATFVQRVGRADHRVDGIPKGRIYPLTRDELVECVALLAAVRDGTLDSLAPPVAPLDILAQQIVAECAASGEDGISEAELLALVRRATPFAELGDETFEEVLALASDGVATGRGVRGAYLHRDRVNGVVRARRGARLAASTSGGAIPELADYRVVLEPDEVVVGSVNEDWAVEAMAGDVFLLGSASWRIRRVEQGTVRVVDAHGAAPTLPFWLGEAPARTDELADHVAGIRESVAGALLHDGREEAARVLEERSAAGSRAVEEVVAYLATAHHELGALPTKGELVLERFFDDAGGMQLVVHSPYGARVNRGLGLALRKRFCVSFDFELQAAASDDAVVISLGPQHSFPLEEVTRFLSPATVRDVLVQAVLPTPIFGARWRWNLSRSLVSPRFRGSRHLPPAIQRMEADDLMAAIFPALAACQENTSGPIPVPDHPIVRQTIDDCFTEAIDLAGLVSLVTAIRSGEVRVHCVDTSEPSVLSHEILNGRPYTFLDDAPLEERRSRAVPLRRGLPVEARDLTRLDPAAVEEVRDEVAPSPRDAEELHELLLSFVLCRASSEWSALFDVLSRAGRAMRVELPAPVTRTPGGGSAERPSGAQVGWCATERRAEVEAMLPGARFLPDQPLPRSLASRPFPDAGDALALAVRGHLEHAGPTSPEELASRVPGASVAAILGALAACEASGAVLRLPDERWCARHLVARIHARGRSRERSQHPPASARDFIRFLLSWQHVLPGTRLTGVDGLASVVAQLQGIEAPVSSWEESILPARVAGYQAHLLDELCANGEVGWGRLGARVAEAPAAARRAGATPSRATPVALARREDLAWLLAAARGDARPPPPGPGAAADVLESLAEHGAIFFSDLCDATGRLPLEVAEGLWDGVARGLVTSDGFRAVRALLSGRYRTGAPRSTQGRAAGAWRVGPVRSPRPARPGAHVPPALAGGRWSLLPDASPEDFAPDEIAEAVAFQLLSRWGVVFREPTGRETLHVPWRDVLLALRRLEARGVARGGRFVAGASGEQYGLPEAVDELRRVARREPDGSEVLLCAADPLNLTGLLLPGPRVPAVRSAALLVRDGSVVDASASHPRARVRRPAAS